MAERMASRPWRSAAASIVGLLSLALASCSALSDKTMDMPQKAYVATDDGTVFARYAPIFALQNYNKVCNRIGAPAARRGEEGEEDVYVDHKRPVFYVQKHEFQTDRGTYTNLIYRVHFDCVPFPHVTMGRNVGLLAVVTLDADGRPVLLTTVPTGGCCAVLMPTSHLPDKARPKDWNARGQARWAEDLPGRLAFPEPFDDAYRAVIVLRDETHRVMDVRVESVKEAAWRYQVMPAELKPVEALEALPLDGGTTSFYHTTGPKRGLVKGAAKPFEFLLVSWWAMDRHVGRDRRYADSRETGRAFYTSLKFWKRQKSDMWRFPEFLRSRGWQL